MQALELLAPALSADIGIAAISCGADAVYIGGPAFGARVAAANSIDDIKLLCSAAAPFGVRIYVTLNTLARDEAEKQDFVRMAMELKDSGIAAFIIQDATLMPLLAAQGPWKEEFHASTQCAIRTPERALQLEAAGFTRLILERQLSLEQIRSIRKALKPETELEFFVHGAICVCYSGDCYLSEALTGRSANRGECAQPCRNLYDLVDGKGTVIVRNKPLLSLRDFQLIDRLEDLAREGICSFKIEGRLKNESYVKNIVRAYSDALDKLVADHPDKYRRSSLGKVEADFAPDTRLTFNRGYTSLFIDGVRDGKWQSGDAAKAMGQRLGKVVRCNRGASFHIEIDSKSAVHNGDGLCFIDAKGEVCGIRADRVEGKRIFCKAAAGLREGVLIYRNRDIGFERTLETCQAKRFIGADLELHFGKDGILEVEITREDGRILPPLVYRCSEFPGANDRLRMENLLHGQLCKTSGIYRFSLTGLRCDATGLPLLSASFINGIRREAAEALNRYGTAEISGEAAAEAREGQKPLAGKPFSTGNPDAAGLKHPRREGELMRSRYCIMDELGLCLKKSQKGCGFAKNGIYLRNNNRLLRLEFDCAVCEMVVKA